MNLSINPVFNNISAFGIKFQKQNNISFGKNNPETDIFQKRVSNTSELEKNSPELQKRIKSGEEILLRETKLYNRKTGKYENAYITQHIYGPLFIYSKDRNLGSLLLSEGDEISIKKEDLSSASNNYKEYKFLQLDNLETENRGEDACEYHGIGTELIKQAVIESKNKGYDGRIALVAGNYTGIGRPAETFYQHIGLVQTNPTKNKSVFALKEEDVKNFISR